MSLIHIQLYSNEKHGTFNFKLSWILKIQYEINKKTKFDYYIIKNRNIKNSIIEDFK